MINQFIVIVCLLCMRKHKFTCLPVVCSSTERSDYISVRILCIYL